MRLTAAPNEIMTRAPLLQAAVQMESGWDGERGPKAARWYWDGCPKLKPVPANALDLRGQVYGRLTVVGLLDKPNKNGASWVVRCFCGQFETRKAKALRQNVNGNMGCTQCDYLWHIKRQAFFDRANRWPSCSEVPA